MSAKNAGAERAWRRMLTDRQRKILKAIIDVYIQTAEPVGSKALAQSLDQMCIRDSQWHEKTTKTTASTRVLSMPQPVVECLERAEHKGEFVCPVKATTITVKFPQKAAAAGEMCIRDSPAWAAFLFSSKIRIFRSFFHMRSCRRRALPHARPSVPICAIQMCIRDSAKRERTGSR